MEITSASLGAINNALNLQFNTQFWAAPSVYKKFTTDTSSTGRQSVYPRLSTLPGLREWIGSRIAHSLSQSQFTITNKKFEETITISRDDIEDDIYGIYAPVAAQMGQDAGQQGDLLVAKAMKAGTTTPTYDNQNFFDVAHPNPNADGVSVGTVANYAAGSYTGWYLIDSKKVLKPFIYQTRVPFSLTTRFNVDDPSVFDNDEFLWGIRGRCNAGFGLWQLAYYSTLELTPTNVVAARTAMASIRRPNGTPMGVTGDTIIVPTSLYPQARKIYEVSLIENDPATPTTLVSNIARALADPIEFPFLN